MNICIMVIINNYIFFYFSNSILFYYFNNIFPLEQKTIIQVESILLFKNIYTYTIVIII